ncbi:hypothetical protein VTK73DRAFT_5433 [Phialemonium thermophilum]|uniref:Stress-induced protein n=1 Tax=Phialemonium thermophilum TaxID=223376 RepID=A0ABR3WNV8_9PEZI
MGKGKMDDAAAERIRKAKGDKNDFARRAAIAARQNREKESGGPGRKGGKESIGNKDVAKGQDQKRK